jgi:hypothetical protein
MNLRALGTVKVSHISFRDVELDSDGDEPKKGGAHVR